MPKERLLLDQRFKSQQEVEAHFYAIRDQYSASKADINHPQAFKLLRELYLKYGEYTDWPVPAQPIVLCVRDGERGAGGFVDHAPL